jgi:hypothetical protein
MRPSLIENYKKPSAVKFNIPIEKKTNTYLMLEKLIET